MKEENAFDILIEYPKVHGLDYETHERKDRYYAFPNDPVMHAKYVLFKKDNIFFFAYDSFSTKFGSSHTFSGVYSVLDVPDKNIEFEVTKKDWLDIFFRNKRKSKISFIDKNLTIRAKYPWNFGKIFPEDIAALFLELTKHVSPLKLFIRNEYLNNIQHFAEKKIIGIETNRWIYRRDDVDILLKKGDEIIRTIQKRGNLI